MKAVPFKLRKSIVRALYHRKLTSLKKARSADKIIGILEEVIINSDIVKFKPFPAGALTSHNLEVRENNYLESVKAYFQKYLEETKLPLTACRCECYSDPLRPRRGKRYYISITHKLTPDSRVPFEGLFLQLKTRK